MPEEQTTGLREIPGQIMDRFLNELASGDVPKETVARLRALFVEKGRWDEDSIRRAIVGEDET